MAETSKRNAKVALLSAPADYLTIDGQAQAVLPFGNTLVVMDLTGMELSSASMLDEGTKKRDTLEISDDLARVGANLSSGADLDTLTRIAQARRSADGPQAD